MLIKLRGITSQRWTVGVPKLEFDYISRFCDFLMVHFISQPQKTKTGHHGQPQDPDTEFLFSDPFTSLAVARFVLHLLQIFTLKVLFLNTKERINVHLLLAESDLENETTMNVCTFEAKKVAHRNKSFAS